jgi:catechol 2,3-dioxygenase-like lactoylglutathione lyase family enzyme
VSVVGLHHAGLRVSNLERSIVFYHDVFGLELAERLSFGAEQIAFMSVGSSHLELIEAAGAARPTGVVDHVAFEIENLAAWLHRFRTLVTLVDQAPVLVPRLHARILFCLGPDDERIELFEHDTFPELT